MRNPLLLLGTCLTAAAGFALAAVVPTTQPNMAVVASAPALTPEQSQFFETKVRPILTDRCYKCHSIEQAKARGGLTLDTREGWMKGGENGAVIAPGNPDESKLIKAIKYEDPDLQMPPKGEKLTDQQIADLTEWIKMGAPDPRVSNSGGKLTGLNDKARAHWAYQAVKDPEVPEVKDKAWLRTPVDNFILAKLEENGIKPSHPAPRATLIRRAYYDLIGLPPTPKEVEAFVNDRSPNAFEKVVDHLLDSPHYGERWARFWLDSARYADTTGSDQVRRDDYRYAYAWTYRDWVIKSLNDDKPYDEFLKEQIAADQLPEASKHPENLAALGFLTVGKRFANPNDTIDERIDTLCKATMALTVSCARCHDHKFDPIPQADYYSLHGVFSSIMEPEDKPLIGTKPAGTAYADYKHRLGELEQKNRTLYFDLIQQKSSEFREKADAYIMAQLLGRRNRTPEALQERNKLIAEYKLDRDVFGALRFNQDDRTVFAPLIWFFDIPPEEFSQQAPRVLERIANGGNANFRLNKRVMEAFASVSPNSLNSLRDVARVYGKLFSEINDRALAYLKANRMATSDAPITGFDQDLIELANIPAPVEPAPRITTDRLRELIPRLPAVNNAYNRFVFSAINELELTHPGAPARAMIVQDLPKPHDDPIFIRGEAGNRGKIVPREFLEILSPKDRQPFRIGSGRLELAEDIANKNNPLTARVMINRIWMHHFGDGFVRTPDDLGVQSEPPSHPELLDYLASRFMEQGWSIKKMHKLIMLSNTYQQSSDTNNLYSQKDPENRLLWRANLRRLDFEAIRDTLLMFTGHLDPTIGGKPVNLTEEPYSFRRSIYGYIDRGALPELMGQFDFSDPDRPNSHRTSTIVPQQALFFMNSPMSADVARKVCTRPEFLNAPNDEARVKALYEVLFQRPPKGAEQRFAAEFFYAHSGQRGNMHPMPQPRPEKVYQRPRNEAKRAIENEGEMVERRPLNLWEQYAQALLFTNEIAYVN